MQSRVPSKTRKGSFVDCATAAAAEFAKLEALLFNTLAVAPVREASELAASLNELYLALASNTHGPFGDTLSEEELAQLRLVPLVQNVFPNVCKCLLSGFVFDHRSILRLLGRLETGDQIRGRDCDMVRL